MPTTLATAKSSRIPVILGLDPSDPRVADYINEAQQRLLQAGRWWATVQRIQLCVTDGCIVWPRGIANIEQLAVNGHPVAMRNGWYEFMPGLGRVQQCGHCGSGNAAGGMWGCGHLACYDRGITCTASAIRGPNKKIRVYPASASDVGKKILFQGIDDNQIEIRNQYSGQYISGEYLTLQLPYVESVSTFYAITAVQKAETNDIVRVYQYDTVGLSERLLSIYEPGETEPSYRKSFIPHLAGERGCGSTCETKTVTALAKLDFIPARRDTDWLVIGNIPALKDMCHAIIKEEKNEIQEAEVMRKKAIRTLDDELRTNTGDRAEIYVNIHGSAPLHKTLGGFV